MRRDSQYDARTIQLIDNSGGNGFQLDIGSYRHTRLSIVREDSNVYLAVNQAEFNAGNYFIFGAPAAQGPAVIYNLDGISGFVWVGCDGSGNSDAFALVQW